MANIHTHILGFPRIGHQRELKFALEKYWSGDISTETLEQTGSTLRQRHWALQKAMGMDHVSVGDFAFYDHVANHIQLLGCEPERFGFSGEENDLDRYFTMARGIAGESSQSCCAHHGNRNALEMTKWFDTNYHYLVPEFTEHTRFSVASERLFNEVREAQELGHSAKAVLIGPLTFLWLGKEKTGGFERLSLLDQLIPVYCEILHRLKSMGVEWVQIDEPILGVDLPAPWRNAFERTYWQLAQNGVKLMLATYFSTLEENLRMACMLPIAGLHIDAVRAPNELFIASDWLADHKILSAGIIDGRNVWRADLDQALAQLQPVLEKRRGNLWLAPSCSLLHVPVSLAQETGLDTEIRSWLAFAEEKMDELKTLKEALEPGSAEPAGLLAARAANMARRSSPRIHRPEVMEKLQTLPAGIDARKSSFPVRQRLQRERFRLPGFPTTTIGSFPQTPAIRSARLALRNGSMAPELYEQQMQHEIAYAVKKQEELGIDVLVHGEAERNDMVEYFGEQLDGFAFTGRGWVQSYGSRCVKPPIIYGDVRRPHAMTVKWASYAQSLTKRPMKGMLTGPVTILQWSFVRNDQPRARTALQIALAMRDEVTDLERAGIGIIQIDEPAIREGLPLRRSGWKDYLDWATRAFRICASGVDDSTQIHTHMCYAEFNDILPAIAAMDADVITIETSRSDMELLRGFGQYSYPNEIGPGVYDIHSPRTPSVDEMTGLLRKAAAVIPRENLWVNPDCGLKTRKWDETESALRRMVEAARQVRAETCKAPESQVQHL
ncbi:5-methyltetrahydropteroyltriglutamate--homocysteine S-methyltransferase [Oxalobacteraceae bacterium R-40]|uniref:5-methyltetrahydropteroyltriglutamate--homocysteine methyltransferase n=1 Tax=Keguizhuia sedimenti TaxID=3064264 RepID=A0ABU1BKX0_9BURK|nr:5-methyltetrahydropteroyltriglutamate--homocysteine S-methyltransferase [Oxalobacteraceae bacterium R-40]